MLYKHKNNSKQKQKNGPNLRRLDDKQNLLLSCLKKTDLKISFETDNTIGKLLAQNKNTNFNKFNKSGVYQLTCQDCNRKYIGQTGRPFYIRFQENLRDFKYENGKSKFAQHLIDNRHSITPMENIEVLHTNKKRQYDEHPWKVPYL